MQTQQINAAIGNIFFTSGGSMASVDRKATDSFETLFRSSSEKYDMFTVQDTKNVTSKTLHTEETVTKSNEQGETESLETGTTELSEADNNGEISESKQDASVTEEVEENQGVSKEEEANEIGLAEIMAMLIMQTAETVKEELHLTEEQLSNAMELLGITKKDLLDADVLKQLVLTVNGEQNPAAFLMNNDLLLQMQELAQVLEQLMEEAGVSKEDVMALLADQEFEGHLEEAMADLMAQPETDEMISEQKPEAETDLEQDVLRKELEISFKSEEDVQEKVMTHSGEMGGHEMENKEFRQGNETLAGQFIQNLEQAFTEGVQDVSLRSDLAAQIREIADQILEQVKMVVTPETTSLEIQLTPEQLGKVNVTVTEQDGVMKASFVTENELAKEAIESNLVQFKQMMNEQGIRVESIEVTVSEFTFDKNGQAGQNGQEEHKNNKTRFVADQETDSVTMQDELALHFLEGGESTVNYMA